MVQTHLLQYDGGQQAVTGSGPVGKACHGCVEVVTLLLGPVVGIDDQLWRNSMRLFLYIQ